MADSHKKIIRHPRGSCWPTPEQTELLHACLGDKADALPAWERWRSLTHAVPWGKLDIGSRRLLPLLYRNLTRFGLRSAETESLKNCYRTAWARNRMLLAQFRPLLAAFREEGIELMILKGAALAPLYYRDDGTRPMSDVDFLFRPEQALRAFALLETLGWKPVHRDIAQILPLTHSYTFKNQKGEEIDPHWHALHEGCRTGDDESFWTGSIPFELEGFPLRAMNAADQLLHLCSHGLRWNRTPPLRWIADALILVQGTGASLDWPRLTAQAERLRLIQVLWTALGYLDKNFALAIPAATRETLEKLPTSCLERTEFRWKSSAPGFLGPLPVEACLYLRLERNSPFWKKPGELLKYFRLLHNFPTYRKLFRYIFFLAWKHAWGQYAKD